MDEFQHFTITFEWIVNVCGVKCFVGSQYVSNQDFLERSVKVRLAAEASGVQELGYYLMMSSSSSSSICEGSIGECLAADENEDEFAMESESSRCILAYRRRYISYGVLRRNRVPCSRRGASICPGAQVNPYRWGCRITRCRG